MSKINAELAGATVYDGMRLTLPANVVAVVLISEEGGDHIVTLFKQRGRELDDDTLAGLLIKLGLETAG
jgi:hypothetical protein